MDIKLSNSDVEQLPDWKFINKIFPLARFLKRYHNYRIDGLNKIPKEGRALILVNHSLATYDILLLAYVIMRKLERLPRGLADRNFYKTELIAGWMQKLGIHEASSFNAQHLLEQDELLILAPGGTKEAIRSSKEKYQVKWHDRYGFAKLSIKAQAPIILAACPGADNIYTVKDSVITDFVYNFFKFPLPFADGIKTSLLPRPEELVHYIHEPIIPPTFEGDEPSEELIKEYHTFVVSEMENLMQEKLKLVYKE
jgi:1-acyl-sn-glycerol-3-phosphate acyltransferase